MSRKGWLIDHASQTVLIHPIIATVVRAEFGIDVRECEGIIKNITEEITYSSYDNYADKWEYFPHTRAVARNFEKNFLENESISNLYFWIGNTYQDQGDYEKALMYYEKALNIYEKVLGREHPYTATTYHNMAGVFEAQGDYEKALTYYEQAFKIREQIFGMEHPYTSDIYQDIEELKYTIETSKTIDISSRQ